MKQPRTKAKTMVGHGKGTPPASTQARSRAQPKHSPPASARQPVFNPDRIAEQHAAVCAAPWLAGMGTPSAPTSSSAIKVLLALPDAEPPVEVLDVLDDYREDETDVEADRRRQLRKLADLKLHERVISYAPPGVEIDRVLDEVDMRCGMVQVAAEIVGLRQLTRAVDPADYKVVLIESDYQKRLPPLPASHVAVVGPAQLQPTVSAVLAGIAEALRTPQLGFAWAPEPPSVPQPSELDAALDALVVEQIAKLAERKAAREAAKQTAPLMAHHDR